MTPAEVAHAYFDAWNRHDAAGIVALFAEDGTYHDPASGGPLQGEAIGAYAAALWAGFPDLSFETPSVQMQGASIAAEWRMRGTNTGAFRGLPPTGKSIDLPGSDFIVVQGEKIASVRGYFDGRALPEQLGMEVIVQPRKAGPFIFGKAVQVRSGNRAAPGAFSITFMTVGSEEEAERVREYSRRTAAAMPAMPGFVGLLLASAGERMMTVTAWESEAHAHAVSADPAHRDAMAAFFGKDGLGTSANIGVWVPARIGAAFVRCTSCGAMAKVTDDGKCRCGAALPEWDGYW
jgi:steroid delta-isomerase-like uncharacterized protein